MTTCSAFLLSVLGESICLSVGSKKSHWLTNNSQMTTYQAPEGLLL